jgi:uncharacterized protein (DUF3820 family)
MDNHPFSPVPGKSICSCGRFRSDAVHLQKEGKLVILGDLDPMPFGKYSATVPRTLMQDVPAEYLHHLYTNPRDNIKGNLNLNTPQGKVARYIKAHLSHLQREYPDGIWT